MPRAKNPSRNSKDVSELKFADLSVSRDYIAKQKAADWKNLDPKLKAFAQEYLINGYNHREAAAKIGIAAGRGLHILRNPLVREYIADIQGQCFEANLITKDFIESKLDCLLEMAMGEVEIPMVTDKGFSFTGAKFQGVLALSIIKEKSKMNGITKPDIDGNSILDAFTQAVQRNSEA